MLLSACLEIVNRFQPGFDGDCVVDSVEDLSGRFISQRGFVERVGGDRSGKDAFHTALELVHAQGALGFFAPEKAAGAMRGGIIPVGIAFSGGEN